MNELVNCVTPEEFAIFVKEYFLADPSSNFILGYGLRGDFKVLANTHPAFQPLTVEKNVKNLLDLEVFAKCLTTGQEKLFDLPHSTEEKGLAGLAEQAFGSPLDKRNQRSNWDRRPLREDQMLYAAYDAFVLIELYNKFFDTCYEKGLEEKFYKLETYLRKNQNKPQKTKPGPPPLSQPDSTKPKQQQTKSSANADADGQTFQLNPVPIEPPDLRVVLDHHLKVRPPNQRVIVACPLPRINLLFFYFQGLVKKLRILGIDAVSIEAHEHFEMCGKVAEKEGRHVVTKGNHFTKLKNYVPPGHCLSVNSNYPEEQVKVNTSI